MSLGNRQPDRIGSFLLKWQLLTIKIVAVINASAAYLGTLLIFGYVLAPARILPAIDGKCRINARFSARKFAKKLCADPMKKLFFYPLWLFMGYDAQWLQVALLFFKCRQ
ncbi:MAG: hypothetical protein RBR22_00080 [Desulfuromonas sp.]|nr:hypothetical protein [Desulfuromonas sp.]